jgi:hypothetical protein
MPLRNLGSWTEAKRDKLFPALLAFCFLYDRTQLLAGKSINPNQTERRRHIRFPISGCSRRPVRFLVQFQFHCHRDHCIVTITATIATIGTESWPYGRAYRSTVVGDVFIQTPPPGQHQRIERRSFICQSERKKKTKKNTKVFRGDCTPSSLPPLSVPQQPPP